MPRLLFRSHGSRSGGAIGLSPAMRTAPPAFHCLCLVPVGRVGLCGMRPHAPLPCRAHGIPVRARSMGSHRSRTHRNARPLHRRLVRKPCHGHKSRRSRRFFPSIFLGRTNRKDPTLFLRHGGRTLVRPHAVDAPAPPPFPFRPVRRRTRRGAPGRSHRHSRMRECMVHQRLRPLSYMESTRQWQHGARQSVPHAPQRQFHKRAVSCQKHADGQRHTAHVGARAAWHNL